MYFKQIIFLILMLLSFASHAETLYDFGDATQNQRFETLIKNFRCVTCQNQSLADSSAPIAITMREAIYQKIKAGDTDKDIEDFLVTRYGNFVLYNPPFKIETLVLWLGPFLFLLVGLGFAFRARISN